MKSVHLERNLSVFNDDDRISEEGEFFRWQADKFALLVEQVEALPCKRRIADVGSFTGMGNARYLVLDGVEQVHAFDASQEALKRAESRGLKTHIWVIGQEPCPIRDCSFDLVVASDVIEHLIDTDQFLKDIRGMVAPTGHVIVTTPNLGWWLNRFRLVTGRVPWSYPG